MTIRILLLQLIVSVLLLNNQSFAQEFNLIPGITAKMNYTHINDTYGIAVIGGMEHYLSLDQGLTWTEMNNNSASDLMNVEGYNIAIVNASTMCIVGRNSALNRYVIVRTTDGGNTWTNVVISSTSSQVMTDIDVNNNNLIVSSVNGVFISSDGGLNWIFVTISANNQVSSFAKYNQSSDSWLVGNYSTNFHISSDNGLTWTETNLGFTSSTTLSASSTGNGILLTKDNSSSTQLLYVGSTNEISDTINVPDNLIWGANTCSTAAYLPNGNILTNNNFIFHLVDTSNSFVYYINSPTSGTFKPKKLSLGSTFGIAYTYQSSTNQSRAYLIDYNQAPDLSVSASFQVAGPGPCAGDPIIATPNAYYADSVKWKVNGVLVSTADTLNYPTPPGVYMTYTVQLTTYYNGVSNIISQSIVMSAPSAPHTFVYTVDTTACYGLPLNVFINPDSGTPSNTSIKILYNGQLVYGPTVMTSSNINAYTTPLTTSGLLQIISYKTLPCDPSADTINVNIIIGPNLEDYSVLANDSVICTGINPEIQLTGTNSFYSYNFLAVYTPVSGGASVQTYGTSNDTLAVNLNGPLYIDDDSSPNTYGNIFMYISLQVTDTSGCVISSPIDTFRVQRPTAYFDLHSRSFHRNEAVELSNAYVTDNRLWSSPDLNSLFINNNTDTVPLIIADTTGFFRIQLRNEPLDQCIDSTENIVHIAEEATEMSPVCSSKYIHETDYIHEAVFDPFGNIYEIRTTSQSMGNCPYYVLNKLDPDGNLLWEKRADYQGLGITGVGLESIDFDCEGNPYIAYWIEGDNDFANEYIDFDPYPNQESWCFIAKLDKNTGDTLWRVKLNDLPMEWFSDASTFRITDLVVDNEMVHLATFDGGDIIRMISLNINDGSLIGLTPLSLSNFSSIPPFISYSFLDEGYPSIYTSQSSTWSPQLEVLSTGEVIAIGYYRNNSTFPDYPQLTMTGNNHGIFAYKYHPDAGVYDVHKIAQIGLPLMGNNVLDKPHFIIDNDDNIIVAGYWQNNPSTWNLTPISVLDSSLSTKGGTFLVSMDTDYNMNWLTLGTTTQVQDLDYIENTGEIYLATTTKDNFSVGQNTINIMAGELIDTSYQYTHVPYPYEYTVQHRLDEYKNAAFLTKLNSGGEPLEMKSMKFSPSSPSSLMFFGISNILKIAASPCGDLAFVVRGLNGRVITLDSQTYPLDSTRIFFMRENCSESLCGYVNTQDTLFSCGLDDSLEIQLCDYYNVDSLSFDLIYNGNTLSTNQTAIVSNGLLSISFTSGLNGTYAMTIDYPSSDTLYIVHETINPTTFNYSDTICYGIPIQIEASELNYQYDYGFASGSSILVNPSNYDLGSNTFEVSISNELGCSIVDTIQLFVYDIESGNYNFTDTVCDGNTVLVAASPLNYQYDYGFATGSTVSIDSSNYNSGLNIFEVNISNEYGCTSVDTIQLFVSDIASTNFNYTDTVCNGNNVQVIASPLNYQYDYGFASGSTVTIDSSIYNSGLNIFEVSVSNELGCTSVETIQLFVSTIPSANFNYTDTVCNGNTVQVTASPLNYQYDWGFATGSSVSLDSSIYSLGVNILEVDITDENGCNYIDSIVLFIDDCLSLDENDKLSYQISPNPGNGSLLIQLDESHDEISISVIDLSGKVVFLEDYRNTQLINLNLNLSSSTYILRILSKNTISSERIIITNE